MKTPISLFVSYPTDSAAFNRFEYVDDRFNFRRWLMSEPTTFKKYWCFDEARGELTLHLFEKGRLIDATQQPDTTYWSPFDSSTIPMYKTKRIEPYQVAICLVYHQLALNGFRSEIARGLRQLRAALRDHRNRQNS